MLGMCLMGYDLSRHYMLGMCLMGYGLSRHYMSMGYGDYVLNGVCIWFIQTLHVMVCV